MSILRGFDDTLRYDIVNSRLHFKRLDGRVFSSSPVTPARVLDWITTFERPGLDVFGGHPSVAAVKLLLIDLEEDTDLGRDPFARLDARL